MKDFIESYKRKGLIKEGKNDSEIIRYFDRMRKKRNRFTYDEPELLVSKTETEQAFKNAKEFVEIIYKYIQNKNPQKKLI
ncbi:MAG: hypothetical protein WC998_05820 [Candidatus Paceibacterota bacterium]|jgi:uncharacterized protein (UPF0332 family)